MDQILSQPISLFTIVHRSLHAPNVFRACFLVIGVSVAIDALTILASIVVMRSWSLVSNLLVEAYDLDQAFVLESIRP